MWEDLLGAASGEDGHKLRAIVGCLVAGHATVARSEEDGDTPCAKLCVGVADRAASVLSHHYISEEPG